MLLGRNNPRHQNRLWISQLGRCLAEVALKVVVDTKFNMSQQ